MYRDRQRQRSVEGRQVGRQIDRLRNRAKRIKIGFFPLTSQLPSHPTRNLPCGILHRVENIQGISSAGLLVIRNLAFLQHRSKYGALWGSVEPAFAYVSLIIKNNLSGPPLNFQGKIELQFSLIITSCLVYFWKILHTHMHTHTRTRTHTAYAYLYLSF